MIQLPREPRTVSDVASLLGVKPDTVRVVARWAAERGHPMPEPVRVGLTPLWERVEVEEWVAALPERKKGYPKGRQRT